MLSDLLRNLFDSLKNNKKIEINLIPKQDRLKDTKKAYDQKKIIYLDNPDKEDDSEDNYSREEANIYRINENEAFFINCGSDSVLKNNAEMSNLSKSQGIHPELWKNSDLLNNYDSEVKHNHTNGFNNFHNSLSESRDLNFDHQTSSRIPTNTIDFNNSKKIGSWENIRVELEEFNSQLSKKKNCFDNNCSNSKSPLKNKYPSFLKNKPTSENNSKENPTNYSNLFKKFTHPTQVVNLNSVSNISNFSNLSKNSAESMNKSGQNIGNYFTSNSNSKLENIKQSNILSRQSSICSIDSPTLGKKNKRRYTKLKSLDKNPNLKQKTITNMFNFNKNNK